MSPRAWQILRNQLAGAHVSSPQDAKLVEVALREVEDALVRLARLGHLFHLAEGEGDEPEEWPKVVWHADGRSWEAYDPGHLAELGEGWHETLAEARQQAGLRAQFIGRGGRRMTALPDIIRHFNERSP